MRFSVVIPARYESKRLPGKPLSDIHGQSMIAHVIARSKLSGADGVIVATDHADIAAEARRHGAESCMTSAHHQSGTDRLTEVVELYRFPDDHIIVNVQGDEPLIDPRHIALVAEDLGLCLDSVATLATPITESKSLFDPNVVKVVFDQNNRALYFSRAAIPWDREGAVTHDEPLQEQFFRHIGLYAYRAGFLRKFKSWSDASVERIERLEQLRILFHGETIHLTVTEKADSVSVDTIEDLKKVRQMSPDFFAATFL
ncbi:3-deoxy-D-manno-octulosonate cytidylyltransferase [Exophiala spinifera]|uniref:3-deoxy-manno-octulosonate cytidylyltransferase n=1 Tax=Exophiala spinifera TaxID=91928 RepID=A0A0D1YSC5_9EURO|nr:3-deoxy-D-manno-octulosonate cytidylyltransferase [Exophiala spinifera]KIW18146.1 3-deoxy-D-manno-octulosonate cytidylyltransferase [Exophiala spinifera]